MGDYIFREGEPGNRLFIIVDGSVRISRQIPGAGEEALAVLRSTNESLKSFLALSMF